MSKVSEHGFSNERRLEKPLLHGTVEQPEPGKEIWFNATFKLNETAKRDEVGCLKGKNLFAN